MSTIDEFVDELTRANTWQKEMKTSDHINNAVVKRMRDGVLSSQASETINQDFSTAVRSLQQFIDAARGEGSTELQEWNRGKFDVQFAKYIHKYFLIRKQKGIKALEENAYSDIHYMMNKYIEMIGSNEFGLYLKRFLQTKLQLSHNSQFQAFLVDLFVNTLDQTNPVRARALGLEKFLFIIL